ncbi:hypothetical protein [Emcibacter sp.]|uniref:hypothetical protein n=1 Tax=Emcibacter sp. TaxID=1979954 RepID=UPI002AA77090|nr:hypothetical protein [Emcibacter sp.]
MSIQQHTNSDRRVRGNSKYGPALLCFSASLLALIFVKLSPADNRELAVIFPAGYSLEDSFRQTSTSGAYVTGVGTFDNIVHFRIPDQTQRQRTLDQLYKAGALVVINPFGAAGCFARTPATLPKKVIKYA